ncbi:Uma2 family endonuclease [Nocardia sp. NPDC051900]|uniref:Uma2 family endonuclease n=1 Tax=Nocardia sp. NPDC051900 TaxID=3364326 RepID=UPI0037A3B415
MGGAPGDDSASRHRTLRVRASGCATDAARHLKIAVEIISPSHVKTDRLEKMGEYAAAGIPWYWLVSVSDTEVTAIETYGLDHSVGHYRLARVLKPQTAFAVDLPIRIQLD